MNSIAISARSNVRLTRRQAMLVVSVSMGFVVSQLDVTIVNVALATIGKEFHSTVVGLQWIVDAYGLAFASLLLSAGAIGDRVGSRRAFSAGLFIFACSSAACGLAHGVTPLVIGRALQGLGAAAMLPNSLVLLNRSCEDNHLLRARAVGLWTAAGAVSIAAGPIAGGLLISAFGWRSIFWVNVPLCLCGILATGIFVEKDEPKDNPQGFDLSGQLLSMIILSCFVGAMIEWRPLGLSHPLVYGGSITAVIAAVALIWLERRIAFPMLPPELFRDRMFVSAVAFGACMNLTYYGMVFVLSIYLQQVLLQSPLATGLAFLPLTGGFLLSNLASGHIVGRFGVRTPMIIGSLLDAAGVVTLGFVTATTPVSALLLPFFLIPAGMGIAVPAMTSAFLGAVPLDRTGTASAVLSTARQAAGTLGVAVFGALMGETASVHPGAIVTCVRISAAISVVVLLCAALAAIMMFSSARTGQNNGRLPAQ